MERNDGRAEGNSNGLDQAENELVRGNVSEQTKAIDRLKMTQFCLDHAAEAIFWMGADARLTYVNETACRSLGYSREELLSMTVHNIDPNFPKEAWAEHWEQLRRQGSFTIESVHRTRDGRTFPVEITVNYLNYEGKEYNCAFARDITDRKRSEEAIKSVISKSSPQHGPKFFQTMAEHLAKTLDADFSLIGELANDEGTTVRTIAVCADGRMQSNFEHDLEGTPCADIVGKTACSCASGAREKFPSDILLKEMGAEAYVGVPLFDSQHKALGIMVTLFKHPLDSTELAESILGLFATRVAAEIERNRAEEALRETQERFSDFFKNAPIGFHILGPDQVIVDINDAELAMIGYEREEVVGKMKWSELIVPEEELQFEKHWHDIITVGHARNLEYTLMHKDGYRIDVVLNASSRFDQQGNFVSTRGSVLDITARKHAEQARHRLLKELEAKHKELESVLYAASHDLKSPLVNIQGFGHELSESCDLIRSALKDAKRNEQTEKAVDIALNKDIPVALDFILTSTTKMDSLLSGLLDLCRLNTVAVKIEPIDMDAMMAEVVASIGYQIEKAGARVDIEPLPYCLGDASQISRVFTNLLTNALKFLPEADQGHIRIHGRSQGNQSIYEVEDNGIGIASEHIEKIFEIFYQLEPQKRQGEGIGLAIVRRIIDRHNGKVWAESKVGAGSKFFVALPGV